MSTSQGSRDVGRRPVRPPERSGLADELAEGGEVRLMTGRRLLLLVAIVGLGCHAESPGETSAAAGTGETPSTRTGPPFEGLTSGDQYRVRARPAELPIPLHRMHEWIIGIELVGDAAVAPSSVSFDGGMPSHGHGFVTRPRVTRNLGGGEFLVEGVKFHMPGEWVVSVTVQAGASSEQVTWPLVVEP